MFEQMQHGPVEDQKNLIKGAEDNNNNNNNNRQVTQATGK